MLTRHIALVPEVGMNASELARVSAALQKQVTRDLAPVWGISATVDAFPCLEDLPAGYWPLVLTFRELGVDAGIHIDEKGQPYALVEMSPSWSLTASHICLEMLSDPFGNRMLAGNSPRPDQGQVEFLTDICDPCGHPQYAYVVNDVLVSDFCTPSFWEPASRRERYSFTGAVQAPLEVLPGGHMRWYDPTTDTWWTRRILGDGPCDVNIGRSDSRKSSPREFVDAHTPHHLSLTRMTADAFEARMGQSQQQSLVAGRSRAYLLRTTLGTSRPSRPGRGNELEVASRGERTRHPQVLGALLRASMVGSGTRDNPAYEETVLADDVEEVTTVDDMTSQAPAQPAAPAATFSAELEVPVAHRTVPPPLPQTPPPAEPTAAPNPAPSFEQPPLPSSLPPAGAASIRPSTLPGVRPKTSFNSTIAIAVVAAAVVLGLALRDRSTPQAGAAASPRPDPATTPAPEARPAPAPAAPPIMAQPAAAAPTAAASVAPPAAAAPTAVATPAAAAITSPPAVAARPRPVAAAPAAPRAPRPAAAPAQDSLDSLIDDRR